MNQSAFYKIVTESSAVCASLAAYVSLGYSDRYPAYQLLEDVRATMVEDMYEGSVIDAITEAIRGEYCN